MCKLRFSEEEEMPKILKINQIGTSLITRALRDGAFIYFWFSENIGLVVQFYSKKKKKKKNCLYFLYIIFFFENQIYKWIKKFENQ